MSAKNRTLMSEVEDSMRKQRRNPADTVWDATRQGFIDMAAWMLIVVSNGDKRAAAAKAEDESGDSKS